jgi:flagellar hook assembly protein FlgD
VTLKIYDLIGKETATLISAELPSGNHAFQWDAENQHSGVYFCRLQVGSIVGTKKLVLLR